MIKCVAIIAEAINVMIVLKVECFVTPLTVTIGLFAAGFDGLGEVGTFINSFPFQANTFKFTKVKCFIGKTINYSTLTPRLSPRIANCLFHSGELLLLLICFEISKYKF